MSESSDFIRLASVVQGLSLLLTLLLNPGGRLREPNVLYLLFSEALLFKLILLVTILFVFIGNEFMALPASDFTTILATIGGTGALSTVR